MCEGEGENEALQNIPNENRGMSFRLQSQSCAPQSLAMTKARVDGVEDMVKSWKVKGPRYWPNIAKELWEKAGIDVEARRGCTREEIELFQKHLAA